VTISQLSAVKTMIIQQVTFLAKDFDNTEYQFSGTLFPNGAVMVSYAHTNDGWFESLESVDACGNASVINWELGKKSRMSRASVRESLKGAVREFGSDRGTKKGFKLL
jgi:hypothetical protein